jgi:hypothetical protein
VPQQEPERPSSSLTRGEEWSLAAFSGSMQLGNTQAMLGRMDEFIMCYGKGLEIQMVAETCK